MSEELSDGQREFVFRRGSYLVELTGKKAQNLKEFLKGMKAVDDESIFYHMYHTLLQHHFVIPEYFNDFAHWLRHELHEDVLAERLTYIGISEYGDIETVREKLIEIIEETLEFKSGNNLTIPEDRAFHFVRSKAIILPTKYRAKNLDEFVKCLEKIDRGTLFYHFFSSRLKFSKQKEKHVDDFSRWICEISHCELADRITSIYLYGYTLEGVRKEIIRIIREMK